MDDQLFNPDNPAKRRCLSDRNSEHSDSLFMSQSPEPTTAKDSSTIEDALDDNNDYNGSDSEPASDEPKHNESREPFPACLAFHPTVDDCHAKGVSIVETIASKLGPYASMNKDLENMFARTAEVMTSRPREIRVAMLGGTGAGE
jgi:hypothetical protein